jgi:hypothetical protein
MTARTGDGRMRNTDAYHPDQTGTALELALMLLARELIF